MAEKFNAKLLALWKAEFEYVMSSTEGFKPEHMVWNGEKYNSDVLTAAWDGWRMRAELELDRGSNAIAQKHESTHYDGLEFKNRLEAQWAAFFDLANWKWRSSPRMQDGWRPDFRVTFPCSHSDCGGEHTLLVSVVAFRSLESLKSHPALGYCYGVRDEQGKRIADGGAVLGSLPAISAFEISHGAGGGVFSVEFFVPNASELWEQAGKLIS